MPARMLSYRFFAKTYGWTPEQVREHLTDEEFEWLPKVEQAHRRVAEMKHADAQQPGRHARQRGF